jgi:hypothetical protein
MLTLRLHSKWISSIITEAKTMLVARGGVFEKRIVSLRQQFRSASQIALASKSSCGGTRQT